VKISVRLTAISAAAVIAALGLQAAPADAATPPHMARPVRPAFTVGNYYLINDDSGAQNIPAWNGVAGSQLHEFSTPPSNYDQLFVPIRSRKVNGVYYYQWAAANNNGAVSNYCITFDTSNSDIVMDACHAGSGGTDQYWWWATQGVEQIDTVLCQYTNPSKPAGGNHPFWWLKLNGNNQPLYGEYSEIYGPLDVWFFTNVPK
jgi:hypothetical protein